MKTPLILRSLDLPHLCDICGRQRSQGNHQRCSRKRQQIGQQRRQQEAQ
ncbi:hypothetical protein UMZ34_24275 [Halopseudomonas pachastrellae]|jgi:hypothetical protein|nr:hypothetical protein UMZ34_24275 [Halopseudomonas pachastrellae]